ncbi:MAG: hypothetical protein ABFS46_04900, partial [Myxococcota bacterium]
PGDEEALSQFDAKRLLGRNGPLAEAVGSITPSCIARLMQAEEFHPDVRALLTRLSDGFGMELDPPVTIRRRLSSA